MLALELTVISQNIGLRPGFPRPQSNSWSSVAGNPKIRAVIRQGNPKTPGRFFRICKPGETRPPDSPFSSIPRDVKARAPNGRPRSGSAVVLPSFFFFLRGQTFFGGRGTTAVSVHSPRPSPVPISGSCCPSHIAGSQAWPQPSRGGGLAPASATPVG